MSDSASTTLSAPPRVSSRKGGDRVSDRVTDRILARIASGEWAPGSRLPGERQLAEEMGVSRVSIRAALQGLKTQGFLDAVQGGGTKVISNVACMDSGLSELVRVNHANLADLAEIRAILEVWAVRRAAQSRTEAQLADLSEIMAATERDISKGKHKTENDIRFHLAIAGASGSGVYIHLMATLRGILQQMLDHHRYEMFATLDDDRMILAHHRTICQAIRNRDPDGAAEAMRLHLEWVVDRYRQEQMTRG